MLKEKVQECIDIFDKYYWKEYAFYDRESNKISNEKINTNIDETIFFHYTGLISCYFTEFGVEFSFKKYFETNETYIKIFGLKRYIFFDKDGNITKNKIHNLPDNIFDWKEADFFYFKLKYG